VEHSIIRLFCINQKKRPKALGDSTPVSPTLQSPVALHYVTCVLIYLICHFYNLILKFQQVQGSHILLKKGIHGLRKPKKQEQKEEELSRTSLKQSSRSQADPNEFVML